MGAKRTKAQQKRFLEKQRLRKKKIKRVQGILANLTGHITEQKFFEAFESMESPPWFKSIRKAGKKLDARGVDAVAETDCGLFYLQIKSSEQRALEFMQRPSRKGIGVVVALKKDTPEYIRYQTICLLEKARETKLLKENRDAEINTVAA